MWLRRTVDRLLATGLVVAFLPAAACAQYLYQEHYQWRNDDGTESSATWKANADTPITGVNRGTNIRLRFAEVDKYTYSYAFPVRARLEYSTSTSGPWTPVSTAGDGLTAFEMTTTSGYADGDSTTAQLAGAGTFVAGKCVESPNNTSANIAINLSQYSNFEYCFKATAKAKGSTTYYFRLAGFSYQSYTVYAQLTTAAGEANESPVIRSPLAATGSVVQAFSYTIQATGSEPITYGGTSLPSGLSFNGTNKIVGTAASVGSYSVPLTATSAWGSATQTLALTVVDNMPPVASNQTLASLAQACEVLVSLAWSDPDQPALLAHTFSIVSGPSKGTLTSYFQRYGYTNYPNYYYYKAGTNSVGNDTFTWKCNDGKSDSNVGTVTVPVVANNPPVAKDSGASVPSEQQGYCGLSYSHADSGQTLTFSIVSQPAHGTVTCSGSSYGYYTSASGFAGGDSFTWKCNDGKDDSNVATVTVTVTGVPPVPANQTAVAVKNTPLMLRPLYTGGGGYTCRLVKVGGPSHGAAVVTNGAYFCYTPSSNYVGNDSFTWKMAYSNAATPLTNTATVTCSIKVAESATTDWPQWRFNECRMAQSPHVLPEKLYLQWRRDIPVVANSYKSYADLEYCRPVQMGKTLFVPVTASDCVAAYDTDTGEQRWRYYASGAVRRPPLAMNVGNGTNVVIFGSDDGYVYCLNAVDGAEVWKFRAAPNAWKAMGFGRLSSVWPVFISPTACNGKVYFGAGFMPSWCLYIYCVDAATGTVAWRNDGRLVERGQNSAIGPMTFSSDHTKLYGASGKQNAWILDAVSGELLGHLNRGTCSFYVDGNGDAPFGDYRNSGAYSSYNVSEPMAMTAGGETFTPSSVTALGVPGTVGSMLAGDGKLFVTTTQGGIYCFGGTSNAAPNIYPNTITPLPATTDVWTTVAETMLSRADLKQGLALVWGVGSGRLVEELAKQGTNLMVVAADPDPAKLRALRVKMDAAGWSGARVSTVLGNPVECGFAPYQAGLIASEDVGASGFAGGTAMVKALYDCTRPFGGEVWLPTMNAQHTAIAGWLDGAGLPMCSNQVSYSVERRTGFAGLGVDGFTRICRTGLPDAKLALKAPFRAIAFGEEYSRNNSALNLQVAIGMQKGVKSSRDIYTWLPFTTAMTGYEPTGPTNIVGGGGTMPGTFLNAMFGGIEAGPGVSTYGDCGYASSWGSLNMIPGKQATVFDASTNYWGAWHLGDRGGCSWGITQYRTYAGNGMLAMCGGDSGCGCGSAAGMNATQFAVVPAPDEETWINFRSERSKRQIQELPVKRAGINLGAVADRYVEDEQVLWTHHPSTGRGMEAQPLIPVDYRGSARNEYHHSAQMEKTSGRYRGWVSASQVVGMDGLTVRLASPLVAKQAAAAPVVDGSLNDACWDDQDWVNLPILADRQKFVYHNCSNVCHATVRHDDTALYVGAKFEAKLDSYWPPPKYLRIVLRSREGTPVNAYNNSTWTDTFVLSHSQSEGKRSNGVDTNAWTAACQTTTNADGSIVFTSEMAIPWAALEAVGLWKEQLVMNMDVCGAILNGSGGWDGSPSFYSEMFYYCRPIVGYLSPLYLDVARGSVSEAKSHTVRLYFAEMEDKAAGQRVFDVSLQGQTVLANLDVANEAGGPRRELVKEFTNVQIADKLDIDFVRHAGEPMLSGVEILGTYTDSANSPPVAIADADVVSGPAPLAVTLSARRSYDPDGQIADVAWELGDGRLARGSKIQHVFAEPGTYRVNVVVVDNRGMTAASGLTVTVTAGAPSAFVCSIRKTGGDFTNLSSWASAVKSDLRSATTLFSVSDAGTYTNTTDDGKDVTFSGGATGALRWITTNQIPMIAAVAHVGGTGTVEAGVVSNATSKHWFTISDTGVATRSLLFTVSGRGTYAAGVDDGKPVTFTGGGKGTLRHINNANVAYITECYGAMQAGAVTCASGSFTVSDAGNPMWTAVAECYNDWTNGLVDSVTTSGWITDETHAPAIRAAAGSAHNGKMKAGGMYTGFALRGSLGAWQVALPAQTRMAGLIVDGGTVYAGDGNSMNRLCVNGNISSVAEAVMANSVMSSCSLGAGGRGYNLTGKTFADNSFGKWINCLAVPGGTRFGTGASRGYCVSTNATATTVVLSESNLGGNQANRTASFVNATAWDYHLTNDTAAVGMAGGPGLGADMDGEERVGPTYDVGADQTKSAVTDANGNGIPDAWEIQYFGSTNAVNGGANDDWDRDGMSNYAEWKAGTNPTNATSVLQIGECRWGTGSTFVIVWSSAAGKWYTIRTTTNLLLGFPFVATNHIPGIPPVNCHTVTVDQAAERFYRVVVEP